MTGGFEKKDADKKDKTCIFIVTPEIGIRKIIISINFFSIHLLLKGKFIGYFVVNVRAEKVQILTP